MVRKNTESSLYANNIKVLNKNKRKMFPTSVGAMVQSTNTVRHSKNNNTHFPSPLYLSIENISRDFFVIANHTCKYLLSDFLHMLLNSYTAYSYYKSSDASGHLQTMRIFSLENPQLGLKLDVRL